MLKALQNTDKGNFCQKKVITKMNIRFTGNERPEDSEFTVCFLASFP